VLFGIGGDVQGGLFDAFRDEQTRGNDVIEQRADDARKRTQTNPRDAAAYAQLAEAEYQLAGTSEGFDDSTGVPVYAGASRERLVAAARAWERHLELAGDRASADTARLMRNVYAPEGLNDPAKTVRTQEIIIDADPNAGYAEYARLAAFAYLANQTRKGDLAGQKAEELAPKSERPAVKASIEQAKQQAIQSQLPPDATGGAAGGAGVPVTPPGG
jgi:hypothetical protein